MYLKLKKLFGLLIVISLSVCIRSFAASSYTPDQTPNLLFWFEPSMPNAVYQDTATATPSVANNDPIGHMVDLSGNGYEIINTTATTKPVLRTNVAILNGKTSAFFNGTNNFLTFTSASQLNNLNQQDYTYFVVFVSTNLTGFNTFMNKSGNAPAPLWFISGRNSGSDNFPGRWEHSRTTRPIFINAPYSLGYRVHANYSNPTADLITVTPSYNGVTEDILLNGEMSHIYQSIFGGPGAEDQFILTSTACIGASNAGTGNFMAGYIPVMLMYNRYLTDTEMKQVNSYISSKYGVPMRFNPGGYWAQPMRDFILTDGDSLTEGHLSNLQGAYPNLLRTVYHVNATVQNDGISGQTLAAPLANPTLRVDPSVKTSGLSLYVMLIGSNDLANLAGQSTVFYNNLLTWCAARRAAGYKVAVMTILSRGGVFAGGQTAAGFEADRQTVNANIRAHWPLFADALIDTGNTNNIIVHGVTVPVSNLGSPTAYTNPTYFQGDLVHLTNAGYAILAQAVYLNYIVFQQETPSGNFTGGDANTVVNKIIPFLH